MREDESDSIRQRITGFSEAHRGALSRALTKDAGGKVKFSPGAPLRPGASDDEGVSGLSEWQPETNPVRAGGWWRRPGHLGRNQGNR